VLKLDLLENKLRITAVLTVFADGSKLQPLLIFKGKTNGPKEKSLQNNINVKKGIIYVKCQENAWTDHSLFMFWLNNIWFANNIKKSVSNSLLIMDRATMHFDPDLSKEFDRHNAKYLLIPPGLTQFLQPLDVGINKDIQKFMRAADTNLRIRNKNIHPSSGNDIIDNFSDVLYNKIKSESIINSFKKTGISVKIDDSENHLVNIPEIILENFNNPEEYIQDFNQNLNKDDSIEDNIFSKINDKNMKIDDYFH